MTGPIPLPPFACVSALTDAINNGTPLLVPIYDGDVSPVPNLWTYTVHIVGFAAFYPTASQLTLVGSVLTAVGSLLNVVGHPACTIALDRCIQGYFTELTGPAVASATGNLGGTDFGVRLMSRIG